MTSEALIVRMVTQSAVPSILGILQKSFFSEVSYNATNSLKVSGVQQVKNSYRNEEPMHSIQKLREKTLQQWNC